MPDEPSAEAQEANLGKILARAFLAQLVERLDRPDDGSDQQEAWSMLKDELDAAYRRGYEEAAKWHEQQAATCRTIMASPNSPWDENRLSEIIGDHENYAAELRALATPPEES